MYNLQHNNYHQKPKSSTIYTPPAVSQFIFGILNPSLYWKEYDYDHPKAFQKKSLIFDPCSGENSLLKPWQVAGYQIWGNDSNSQLLKQQIPHSDLDFLMSEKYMWNNYFSQQEPSLVLCNPPFNGYGKQLGSEVWLDKIIELFGKEVPIVLFTPMGFRLNSKKSGKRWSKFIQDHYPPINSIISLPRDIFPAVEFHSEILIFNLPNLQPHYFFHPTNQIEQRTPI